MTRQKGKGVLLVPHKSPQKNRVVGFCVGFCVALDLSEGKGSFRWNISDVFFKSKDLMGR